MQNLLQQAITYHRNGELSKAEQCYRTILQNQPNHPDANHNLGVIALTVQKPDLSLPFFKIAIDSNPEQPQFWLSYLDALIKAEQFEIALNVLMECKKNHFAEQSAFIEKLDKFASLIKSKIETPKIPKNSGKLSLEKEVTLLMDLFNSGYFLETEIRAKALTKKFPKNGMAWKILGATLQQQGKTVEALKASQKAATLLPHHADIYNNLGTILSALGRLNEAKANYQKAVKLNPNQAAFYYNLGEIFNDLKCFEQSEVNYRHALKLKPDYVEAFNGLGMVFQKLSKLEESENNYRHALAINPNFAQAHCNLGSILKELDKLEEAELSCRKAIALKPDLVDAHYNLGNTLLKMGKLQEAELSYKKAITLKPEHAEAYFNLGNVLNELGKLEESETSYKTAMMLKPDLAGIHYNLGNTLRLLGRLEEAEASYRKATALQPDLPQARASLLFVLNSLADYTIPELLLDEAKYFGELVASKVTDRFSTWKCELQPKRLRIGFVSGDFRGHVVSYFLENVLQKLHTLNCELIAYSTFHQTDETTEKLKAYFTKWSGIQDLSDEEAAHLIHNDGVHILIDLSGHTRHSRVPVFAWKPAPIQVTWLGYFATTGVAEMDYILGDSFVTPVEEAHFFVEKIWQLPECYLCFSPPNFALDIMPLPALSNGFITLGCFNNYSKMNDAVVALWARVLIAVPNSKLFLKTKQLHDKTICETTYERFAVHGIESSRLILEAGAPREELLSSYQRVDIALDPFPYPGGTTSVESLWMGVPVLTLRGGCFLSHVGESIAHNAGLSNWIATDTNDYVAKAVGFANDVEALAKLRQGLRTQVLNSPIFDANRFAKNFETAMWEMWRNYSIQK